MRAQGQRLSPRIKGATSVRAGVHVHACFFDWQPLGNLLLPLKGHRVSYGCLVKGMSGWQRQRDHEKCDTRVTLTGRDGHRWQPACQPPLGTWQADRRSGAMALWGNKLHLLEVNAQHTRAHVQMEAFCLGLGGGGSDGGERDGELVPVQVISTAILKTHWQKDE